MKNSKARAAAMAATEADPRWTKVVTRDAASDGQFVYSVKTTGVYCRPSCAARLANPANVRFHATPAAARAEGFRACKRCKPDLGAAAPHAAKVADAARRIAASEETPSLNSLAAKAGLSPHYFHRVFKAVTGLTPKEYAAAHRGRKIRDGLRQSASVTEAIYDAGYNSGSRFYEKSKALLGMTPTRYRAGGADEEIRFAIARTSLGALLVAASEKGVCAILLGDDPEILLRDLQDQFVRARLVGGDAKFEKLVARVVRLVEHPGQGLDLPLHSRHGVPAARVESADRDSVGRDRKLCADCPQDRQAQRGARGGPGLRRQQPGDRHSLSPGGENRWRPVGLSLGRGAQEGIAGA